MAIVTETHFKTKHTDSIISIYGYTVFRCDRAGRRGEGVAVYVMSALQSSRWTPSVAGLAALEVDWVHVGDRMLIAACRDVSRQKRPQSSRRVRRQSAIVTEHRRSAAVPHPHASSTRSVLRNAASMAFTNPHSSANSDPAINTHTQTEFEHFTRSLTICSTAFIRNALSP